MDDNSQTVRSDLWQTQAAEQICKTKKPDFVKSGFFICLSSGQGRGRDVEHGLRLGEEEVIVIIVHPEEGEHGLSLIHISEPTRPY